MNAKTMEGLVGANSNINLINTPMRVYKDARRRGDTAVLERAMGYVEEFEDRAQEYKVKADEGMEEDARDTKEKAELEREEAIKKRKEERAELEERIAESRDEGADIATKETKACLLEISEEGKVLAQGHAELEYVDSGEIKIDASKEPVTYTKSGGMVHMEQKTGVSISV